MAIIFNSKECGITKEEMKLLYRYNLIECNDFTFTVATIPSWAMEEAKNLIGKDFKGTGWNDSLVSGHRKDKVVNMNFIKIICNSFEERDFIHKQGCIVNERKCKGRYECWKCPFATCNISFEVKDNKMKR